jgi:hypothetical protein
MVFPGRQEDPGRWGNKRSRAPFLEILSSDNESLLRSQLPFIQKLITDLHDTVREVTGEPDSEMVRE